MIATSERPGNTGMPEKISWLKSMISSIPLRILHHSQRIAASSVGGKDRGTDLGEPVPLARGSPVSVSSRARRPSMNVNLTALPIR